jgi:hypothetical protein
MGFLLMVKMIAARTRIWPAHGHYMGLNLGLFWQMGSFNWPDFLERQSEGFTGVFQALQGEDAQTGLRPVPRGLTPAV